MDERILNFPDFQLLYTGVQPCAPTCSLICTSVQPCVPTYSLVLLIGLPGSGKSTLARRLIVADPKLQLISTDRIRERLFGDEIVQGEWLLVWREVQRQFQQAVLQISRGEISAAIYDATNAQRRHRREIVVHARAIGFKQIVGLWIDTPVWLCLARNRRRDRQVPEEVILRMHRQLRDAPPSLSEGLDYLVLSSQISPESSIMNS